MKKLSYMFLLLMTSCELMVDVKVPYGKDKLVVNALQSVDSVWTMELTRSNNILSPVTSFFPVDFAHVAIAKPDGSTEELQLEKKGSGRFIGTTHPETGKNYKIFVVANGLDPVEAETTMPSPVQIINIEWDSANVRAPTGPNDFVTFTLPFKVTFTDPPGEQNFYAIEVFETKVSYYTDLRSGTVVYDTTIREVPARIHDPGIASKDDNRQWFPDNIFQGGTYTAPMTCNFWYHQEKTIELQVRLTSMSKEYFRYLETMDLSFDVDGDPFAQPVQIYSNTSNGFGIFAGVACHVRKYKRN